MNKTPNLGLPLETHGHVALAETVEEGFKKIDEAFAGGGGEPTDVTAADITDSTEVGRSVLTATDAAAARMAIGAGASNLAVGTGATDAKAGDYAPPAGTGALLSTGTDATQRTWTAADIAAFVDAKIAAIGT